MKLELLENKVFYNQNGKKREIHPFWLRERVNGEEFVDKGTEQRLFDPTKNEIDIKISNLKLSEEFLEVTFKDGIFTKISVKSILREFSIDNDIKLIKKIKIMKSLIPTPVGALLEKPLMISKIANRYFVLSIVNQTLNNLVAEFYFQLNFHLSKPNIFLD